MINQRFAAILGFAFVAAWIAFGFGDAILCLVGAAAFSAVAAFWRGELDLAQLQDRFSQTTASQRSSASGSTPNRRVQ
jgi:hypothetical protein